MLLELRIRGYAVLDDVTLRLGPGLNVLTGETGAGKSIVVGALSLLLGEKASADAIRSGEASAVVEAVFDIQGRSDLMERLDAFGFHAEDGLLILKREVQAEGRNRAWVGGSPATASAVWEIGSTLVDLHGQHEHQRLLARDEQRAVLDEFAGVVEEARDVRVLHRRAVELSAELQALETRHRELEAQADFLRFQLREIEEANLEPNEEATLLDEARRLEHAEELAGSASRLHERLYAGDDAVAARLAQARDTLRRLVAVDPDLEDAVHRLDEIYHQATDLGRVLGDYASSVEYDPARLEEIGLRRDLLFRLKRKYGPEVEDVLETARRCRIQLDELERAVQDRGDLERGLRDGKDRLHAKARELSHARADAGTVLAREVEKILPELGMPHGTFEVALEPVEEVGPGGAETVEFRVALNPGFEPRPLARVASGGELSRVMLALESLLAEVDRVPTLVFDEVDAGIGGVVAKGVAEKLARVSEHHQVLVVTHLAQLASRARAHLRVEKGFSGGIAATSVVELEGEDRVEEIARMLGGDPHSERSRDHARELLRAG
jgi:DNA repair protein RecN (Recombination protein N)